MEKLAVLRRLKFLDVGGVKDAPASSFSLRRDVDLLYEAGRVHDAFSSLRKRRRRSRDFYRGKQWDDVVVVDGVRMTEEAYLSQQGRAPLKQNMIRPPVKNIIGQYRSNPYKPVVFALNRDNQAASEMMTCALESVLNLNAYKNRDARMLEEFLLSGIGVYKTSYTYDCEREKAIPLFHAVNPNMWACNSDIEDVEGQDVRIIVELRDLSLDDVVAEYAKSEEAESVIKSIFRPIETSSHQKASDSRRYDNVSISHPAENDKCRIIEVWKKESAWRLYCHDRLNGTYEIREEDERLLIVEDNNNRSELAAENGVDVPLIEVERKFVQFWKTYHMSGYGDILFESETPYAHNSHPYSFVLYPLLDGEVWGMVEDLIDQQKMVNRNMVLFDFMIGASAKGVLLVPEDCIPDDMDIRDFSDQWTRYNGVIKIRAKAGAQMPKQVSTNALNIGLGEMIQTQLKLMQDISGVSGAIQGKSAPSGTAASLYAQESQNASLNVLDYLETFASFLSDRDKKLLQVIKQYYTDKQYIAVSDGNYSEDARNFDPNEIANIDFGNSIIRGKDSPAYRMLTEDFLMKMLEQKMITIEMFLEHSSQPFSDKLLQSFKKMKEDMQAGQLPENAPEEFMRQFQQEAGQVQGGQVDPRQAEMMKRLIK